MTLCGAIHADAVVGNGEANALTPGAGMDGTAGSDENSAAVGQGIEGVGDEVGDELADFAIVNDKEGNVGEVLLNFNVMLLDAGGKQGEDGFQQLLEVGGVGMGGGAVEAQGLDGDLGDAVELGLGEVEEAARVVGQVAALKQVEAVGDGGEAGLDFEIDGATGVFLEEIGGAWRVSARRTARRRYSSACISPAMTRTASISTFPGPVTERAACAMEEPPRRISMESWRSWLRIARWLRILARRSC